MVRNVTSLGGQRYCGTFGRGCEGTHEMQRSIIAGQLAKRNPV